VKRKRDTYIQYVTGTLYAVVILQIQRSLSGGSPSQRSARHQLIDTPAHRYEPDDRCKTDTGGCLLHLLLLWFLKLLLSLFLQQQSSFFSEQQKTNVQSRSGLVFCQLDPGFGFVCWHHFVPNVGVTLSPVPFLFHPICLMASSPVRTLSSTVSSLSEINLLQFRCQHWYLVRTIFVIFVAKALATFGITVNDFCQNLCGVSSL